MSIKLINKNNEASPRKFRATPGLRGRKNETMGEAIVNPKQAVFIIDCGSSEKAEALFNAFDKAAWDKNGTTLTADVLGGEPIQYWNVGQYFTACVDPCEKAAKWCEDWLRNSRARPSEGASKSYTFTWWDNEPTSDRRPTTKADLKNCLHKEIIPAADDAEALELAVEYLCDYAGTDPEEAGDTPEEIWDYFNDDWGFGDPIPMVLKCGRRVVKDSGFYPDED